MTDEVNEITFMGVKIRRISQAEEPKYRCEKCKDLGYIPYWKNGELFSRECECAAQRKALQRLKSSGLEDLIRQYTFKAYKTPTAWHEKTKDAAKRFVLDQSGSWFYIAGHPGSGKTHLCTAICGQLIARCQGVRYMLWREAVPKLKAMVTDSEEYEAELRKYLNAPILYIDDFLKGNVTPADLNLAFTILNHRYNSPRKRTILSSERPLREIYHLDAAIAGRIYERAKDYIFLTPEKDWRTA